MTETIGEGPFLNEVKLNYNIPPKCWGFPITGLIRDTPEEAWDSFNKQFSHITQFLKHYVYWRKAPALRNSIDWGGEGKVEYQVVARIIVSLEKIKGLEETKWYVKCLKCLIQ